jgi:GT2 family glycosyltransferase
MRISIIIPNYIINDELEKLAIQTINSFKKTLKGKDWELIIVDDCSTQGSEMLKREADIYIRNKKNLGYAKTMNKGWKVSKGDYIVTANNDIIVYDRWFEDFEQILLERKAGLIGGLGCKEKELNGIPLCDYRKNNSIERGKITIGGKLNDWMFPGGFFMMTRKTFEKLGYFDERFLTGVEDIDYFYRATLADIKMCMTASVWYWHKEGATRYGTADAKAENDKNQINNFRKFKEKWGFDCEKEMYNKIFKE